jgi:hypothetical protein
VGPDPTAALIVFCRPKREGEDQWARRISELFESLITAIESGQTFGGRLGMVLLKTRMAVLWKVNV